MKRKHLLPSSLLLVVLATGCSTPKNVTYFQDLASGESIMPVEVYQLRVRPDDHLSIMVNTQNPALSNMFNLTQSFTRLGTEAGVYANGANGQTSYYTVDPKGDINFPVLGSIHVGGMKRSEIASFIEKRLMEDDLVKQPVVTVEFINPGVSVLGEVARPGRYNFATDQMTLTEAIAQAGDLKVTGQRENVMVIRRDTDGSQMVYRLDLTDSKSVLQSPAYYLQQDDMVYVEPNAKSKRENTAAGNTPFQPSFWISVGSVCLTLATLIVTLTK